MQKYDVGYSFNYGTCVIGYYAMPNAFKAIYADRNRSSSLILIGREYL